MSTNKKYVGEDAARALAAGIGAATPRTWDLTPDDLDSVTQEEQDGMILLQFPTPASLKAGMADIKAGDLLDASNVVDASAFHLTVMDVLRNEESGVVYCTVYASMTEAGEGVAYYFHIRNETVDIVVLPLVEPDPQKLSASVGGSSWQYGAIPDWGDLGQSSAWFYYGDGSASRPRDFKIGDTFRTPTLVPYGCPPSVASDDPADQAAANYAEGTIVGAGKVQNVPYLVVVGAARFGKKTSSTSKDAETITAPGIFYITASQASNTPTYWYVKFYPLLNRWKELETLSNDFSLLVLSCRAEVELGPAKAFAAMWKTVDGLGFDEENQLFTTSIMMDGIDVGLKNLSYAEAVKSWFNRVVRGYAGCGNFVGRINIYPYSLTATANPEAPCSLSSDLEVLWLTRNADDKIPSSFSYVGVHDCPTLRIIVGKICATSSLNLSGLPELEEVRFYGSVDTAAYVNLSDSPKLSLLSLLSLVGTTTYRGKITVAVHADVYAKLTGDYTNESAAEQTEEERAQWIAFAEQATTNNITIQTT